MFSQTIIIGNLGKDPEVRRLESGAVVAKFSVATSESYMDKKTNEWQSLTEWHNVIAWRGKAEQAEKKLKKGSSVTVIGKMKTRKWQDKDGNDRYTTELVADKIIVSKQSGGGLDTGIPSTAPPATSYSTAKNDDLLKPEADDFTEGGGIENIPADDLPF